jgi:phosphate/phosphite/phosphonate ABC transporter binding protein
MRTVRTTVLASLAMLAFGSLVRAADPTWPKEMTFTIMATENPAEVAHRWSPILAQLEADLGVKVKPVVADFRTIGGILKSGNADFGHLMPKVYVESSVYDANFEPVAQFQLPNGSLGFRACLIVHADSDIWSPEDMAGRAFAFNDRSSTSGYLVPSMFFMRELGIDPDRHFSKVVFSGAHEASILAVAHKQVDIASTNLVDLQLMLAHKVPRGTRSSCARTCRRACAEPCRIRSSPCGRGTRTPSRSSARRSAASSGPTMPSTRWSARWPRRPGSSRPRNSG